VGVGRTREKLKCSCVKSAVALRNVIKGKGRENGKKSWFLLPGKIVEFPLSLTRSGDKKNSKMLNCSYMYHDGMEDEGRLVFEECKYLYR